MSAHPLAVAAATWTTDADTLSRAQQIGEQLDALVAAALAETEPTAARGLLHEAVVQLDVLPQWFAVNMPGRTWTVYYEAQRRALHQRAVALFGAVDGSRVVPRLEYEPYVPARSLWR